MHDKILKGITNAAMCGLLVFASGMDSEPRGVLICTIGMAVCGAWLWIFGKANEGYFS